MAAITFDSVTKQFSDKNETVTAVDDLDLEIEDGDFVVLVGPSGCGKTTTLRCIAGLESVTDGEIRLDGEGMTDKLPENRNVSMVFQSYALYPHMTVRENMSFGLKYATDHSKEEIEEKIQDAVGMMGIDDLLDRHPADLSGGQQQRVALGRAIVRNPEAFLMDEPLSNLDAKLRAEMRTYLQQLQEDLGVTTVYVTHDQTEAMTMGDKIAILDDGELQQYGTPAECYHQPQNTFVAEFLGEPSINLIDMTLQDATISTSGFEHEFSEPIGDGTTNSDVIVGVRPEELSITDEPRADVSSFDGTVTVTEHLGKESNVYVETEGGATELTVVVDGEPTVDDEDEVTVEVPNDAIHVFDAKTGEVIRSAEASGDVDGLAGAQAADSAP
ncbi:ABC transporter ATP-binding protein [Salinarchaeum laminariae]|uniref:ABC transporter ATP-binding protein n=1 Tax=Salinarchaeum laminariae TaxID=869888 RepID=UPI0020C0EB4B|nr:ABC transporter ATP-binding protein [Salinarchaeum laminariae]